MCGICGFNWNDEMLARKMAAQIVHRGPDHEGIYVSDEISLAFRRLSIIDLSDNGNQPMFNDDGSVVLVFNGEIYNFRELRHDLEQDGYVFRSNTDSEVIVHGYEKWGDGVLEKLRGMFALAIWDVPRKRLLLARDRIGIKPLYYSFQRGYFLFGSEIKTLLESSRVERRVNYQALYDYLGFEFVPSPETMFAGINKLPAGCSLVYEKGKINIQRYWDLKFHPGENTLSFDEAVEEFRFQLDFAVKSHLVSDVPLGVFLSGGLDSSCIVALMRRHISGPLRTFTIGYKDKSYSELDYAQIVADHCDTEHHVLMLDSLKPEYVEQTLWHLDEPMTDLSTVPFYLLCKQAKEHVTVCLSGEGADESLAGYDRFKAARLDRYFHLIPAGIRKHLIGRAMNVLPDQQQKKGAVNMLKRFVDGANLDSAGKHLRWQYFLTRDIERQLFTDTTAAQMTMDPFRLVKEYNDRCDGGDEINRQIYLDMRYMMADSVLMKVDRMSMASSLEVRVPLLDHVLVEFMASLPGSWKIKGMETKHIFRAALQGLLPDKIVHRGKQGYSLPVKHLLRGELKNYMISLLNDSRVIRENLNVTYVNRLIEEHCAGKANHNHILWALMNVAIWHNRFFA
ncbi:asparagine synthase (glutamine-hydrolyzing) [Desulforhopalus vacuolatus]|uniref:asparagine synthase (glutamine-hydrolyzing) n=1 Tax=Desulforhopalus vacuolatus TaxID=40414 RepID=UPI0023DD1BE8|nr:asparagine synthase (glutamine-hydrolyzing) [Desulforhopalus vacuolatus]